MSDIRVTGLKGEPQRDTHGNPSYFVSVSVDGQPLDQGVLVKHKGDRPLMQVGDSFAQHGFDRFEEEQSQNGKPYLKAKRPQQQHANNNAPRPEDPKRAARIMRQHSQEMALRYATIRQAQGKLPDTFSLEDLFKIADRFDADGAAAA